MTTVSSSGDNVTMVRTPAPGAFFAVAQVMDSEHNSESYTSIPQNYTRTPIVWVDFQVQPNDWIEVHASGQVDQKGEYIMEVVQKLELLVDGSWWEISEETGVNINARTSQNISQLLDRHHEDFMAHGVFDIRRLNFTQPRRVLAAWSFRARESTTSAVVPLDSSRIIVKVWREFGPIK